MIAGVLEIQMIANMARLSDDMRRAERVVGDSMGKVEKSVASASRALSSLGTGLSIGLIADQMRRTADTFTKLDAQIRLSTKSQQQYNQAMSDIRRISTVAQADISATTMLYTRMLNTTEGMGISQAKLATVTETVSYGLKAYGATSAEAASAALQLSQAMGANRLGGEEFRAVMEAMPNVMKVLAKSMGVPLGELRALSIAGKITTAEMVKAFGDPAVAAEFKKMAERAQTITGAWTVARNELTLLFGEFAKSSGLTQGMIAAFNGLAGALRVIAQYLNEIIVLFGAWAALRITQAVYAYVAALIAQRAAALAAAQAELARANMTYGASAATVTAARSSYAYAAANTTLSGSLLILGQRMAAFVSANAAALAILGLGVAALALKRDFDSAIDSVGKFQAKIRGMEVDALRAARQLEVANVAAMKSSIFSGFNERDILFAERRIRMMDAQIVAAEKLAQAEKDAAAGGTGTSSKWQETLMTPEQVKQKKISDLNELYFAEVERVGSSQKAQQQLAKEYLVKLAQIKDKAGATEHQATMERIRKEYEARSAAEGDAMTEAQKVAQAYAKIDWQRLKDSEKLAEMNAYAGAAEAARQQDQLEADKKAAAERKALVSNISDSLMRAAKSGNFGQAIRDDIRAAFEKEVVLPEVKVMVSAGIDWVKALWANTLATDKNSAATTFSNPALLAIAAFLAIFTSVVKTTKVADFIKGTATREGFVGVRGSRFEQGQRWAGGVNTFETYGTLGTAAMNKLNAATTQIVQSYATAADVIGLADVRTRDFTASINTTGDVVAALSDSIGMSLVPTLALFQREGETLQQTASRLTETFKATNDFIVALGVSQSAAFGGFGLGGVAGRDALVAASGGLQSFNQNAQSFIKNFLTPAEQAAPALAEVGRTFSRLGIQGVTTNKQFADLVKQQMALGNTEVVAQLLSVADSFDAVTKSAAEANKQLQALLRKELFGTLVDYIRATNAGGAVSIAAATANASQLRAQENAAANQLSTQKPVADVMPQDISQSGLSFIAELVKNLVSALWDFVKQLPSMIWDFVKQLPSMIWDFVSQLPSKIWDFVSQLPSMIWDFVSQLPSKIWDFMKQLPSLIYDALKGLFGNGATDTLTKVGSRIGEVTGLWSANGNAFGVNGHYAFANGGAFTNGIYSTPTPFMFANGGGFSAGVMGEAGDEAVMPLRRGPDGRLGVSMHGGGEVAAEVRALREEVSMLRRDNQSGQIAIANATQRTYKTLDRWNGEGLPPERIAG